jgi:hypothetical protein
VIYKLKVRKIPKSFYIKLERDSPDTIIGIETDKNGNVLSDGKYSESIHIVNKKDIKKMKEM